MDGLKRELDTFVRENVNIQWQAFFYKRSQVHTLLIPYKFYSWKSESIQRSALDLIKSSLDYYDKSGYTIRDYAPNNNKEIVDCLPRDHQLIRRFCDALISQIAGPDSLTKDVKSLSGYMLYGKSGDKYCCLIGTGKPYKTFTNAFSFAQENNLKEVNTEFYYLKPILDAVITNDNCYLMSLYAQMFMGIISYHEHNMIQVHNKLRELGLVINLGDGFPRRSKSAYTTIVECCGENLERYVRTIILKTSNQQSEIEEYRKIKIVDGKIDCGDMESFIALIDLLSMHKVENDDFIIEANPTKASWKPIRNV